MRSPRRAGFTLIEIIVAMSLTLVVFAITLPFVRVQTRALGSTAGRLDADQTARYAQRAIDRDLRLAVADSGQPVLVQADPFAISFNANLLARDTLDPAALEIDATADSTLTEAWRLGQASALPISGVTFPTVQYTAADGTPNRNETISYFLHPDTITGRSDVYVLYRRVNARDSVQVVRGIHVPDDSSFFSYYHVVADSLMRFAEASLPLMWSDDSTAMVRAVGLRVGGFYRNNVDNEDVIRTIFWRTTLSNAAAAAATDCGAAPTAPTGLGHSKQLGTGSNSYHVRITWTGSTDDASGELDVTQYVLWTRYNTNPVTWTRLATIPARRVSGYRYDHYLPTHVGSVRYGLSTVDCGGATSAILESNPLNLP